MANFAQSISTGVFSAITNFIQKDIFSQYLAKHNCDAVSVDRVLFYLTLDRHRRRLQVIHQRAILGPRLQRGTLLAGW